MPLQRERPFDLHIGNDTRDPVRPTARAAEGTHAGEPVRETLADHGAWPRPAGEPALTHASVDPAVILDAVVEAIIVFEPGSFRVLDANRGARELLGRTQDELLGKSIVDVLGDVDTGRLGGHIAGLASGTTDATTVMLDYARGDGGSMALEIVLKPIGLPTGPRVIIAIARDIGDRIEIQIRLQRLAEQEHARAAELNAVIRAMGEAVVVCAADGTITLTNPAGDAIFPDVEARTYADILGQLHDPDHLAPALGRLSGPVELRAASYPERWIEIATYPVVPGAATPALPPATIVVMRDVTEGRRREAVRETFIGVLSHELRTPVTTIFGGAKLLARETSTLDEDTRRGIFRDIHDEAERLQRLVENVVALNRFGEAVGEVGWEPVLLQRLLPRVVESEDGRWPGVEFKLTIESGLPTVSADPTYVEQVVRNMLSNAAKYGGLNSTVEVQAARGDGEVLVRVLDDGPGFPLEERDQLFDLFYRSAKTAAIAAGAGIGLFVCARLVSAMGGRTWAAPRASAGAEFGFALPELSE